MNNNINIGFGQTFQGFYKIAVIDPAANEVKWESDWNKNLILNQGMNNIAIDAICDSTLYGVAGTGSRPNTISGALSTITQSGATIRLLPLGGGLSDFTSSHSTYTASVNVGDMIQDSDLSESMVTAVNANGVNLTVTPSYTYSNEKTFTIYKTSQVGLEAEITRSSTYYTGIGNCGTTSALPTPHILTHRRTYDFAPEVVHRTYSEAGTAWASSGNNKVFSRVVIPLPVIVSASYQLRIIYDLQATMSPYSASYFTASISGWPHALGSALTTIATQSIQTALHSAITTAGATTGYVSDVLDPNAIGGSNPDKFVIFVSSDSQSLASYGSGVTRISDVTAPVPATMATYILNSYYVDKTNIFGESEVNISNIRSIGVGYYLASSYPSMLPWEAEHQAFCVVFKEPQMKQNTQTLSITFRQTWGRILA